MKPHESMAMRESVHVGLLFSDKRTTEHEKLNRIASKLDAASAFRIFARELERNGLPFEIATKEADKLESEARQIQETLGS